MQIWLNLSSRSIVFIHFTDFPQIFLDKVEILCQNYFEFDVPALLNSRISKNSHAQSMKTVCLVLHTKTSRTNSELDFISASMTS